MMKLQLQDINELRVNIEPVTNLVFDKNQAPSWLEILSQTPWKLKMTAPNNTDRMSYGTKLSND